MQINTVPALSIRQPWADLIITGRKTVEVRSWTTEYRGKVWVHASRTTDLNLERAFGLEQPFKGGFIGSVFLGAIVPLDPARWESWRPRHLVSREYKPGHFGWILERPIQFLQPIPSAGRLNLFRPGAELQHQLAEAELVAIGTGKLEAQY